MVLSVWPRLAVVALTVVHVGEIAPHASVPVVVGVYVAVPLELRRRLTGVGQTTVGKHAGRTWAAGQVTCAEKPAASVAEQTVVIVVPTFAVVAVTVVQIGVMALQASVPAVVGV